MIVTGKRDETGHIPVGVVHQNEYVVPEWMATNPKMSPILSQLESIRKNGFAEGGFTTPQFTSISGNVDRLNNNLAATMRNFATKIRVTNVVTDTTSAQASINNVETESTF